MEQTDQPIASFTTNSFVGNPYLVIKIGFISGMTLMSLGIMLGTPLIVSMTLLISGILIAFGFGMGKVNYVLTQLGVEQNIRRFIPFLFWGSKEKRIFTWKVISSYKNDTDRTRSGGEYEYLKLYLRTSPGEIWITNQHDNIGFQIFKNEFLDLARKPSSMNVSTGKILLQDNKGDSLGTNPAMQNIYAGNKKQSAAGLQFIKERKSFYETAFAKWITIFFAIVTILLVWVYAFQGMGFSNWFRIMFILLPGTVYMIYRVFFGPRNLKGNSSRYNK